MLCGDMHCGDRIYINRGKTYRVEHRVKNRDAFCVGIVTFPPSPLLGRINADSVHSAGLQKRRGQLISHSARKGILCFK